MRTVSAFVLGLLLGVTAPMAAGAVILNWNGTLTIEVGSLINGQFAGVGSSASLVNGSGGGGYFNTLWKRGRIFVPGSRGECSGAVLWLVATWIPLAS